MHTVGLVIAPEYIIPAVRIAIISPIGSAVILPGLILQAGTPKAEVALGLPGRHIATSVRFIETDTQRRYNNCGSKDNITQTHDRLNTCHQRNEIMRKQHHASYHGQRDRTPDNRQY